MATTAELLAQARSAYHALMTGTAAVEVREADGSTIRYNIANKGALRQYILELEALEGGVTAARPPFVPIFGSGGW